MKTITVDQFDFNEINKTLLLEGYKYLMYDIVKHTEENNGYYTYKIEDNDFDLIVKLLILSENNKKIGYNLINEFA